MMTKTAQLMEGAPKYDSGKTFQTDAKWYRVDPPMTDYGSDEPIRHVIVSASNHPKYGIYETYIFPCDSTGKLTGWGELPGSFRGGLDHEQALRNAGYEVLS